MGLFKRKPKALDLSGFVMPGNIVPFGRFPIKSTSPEPIPWRVIETDMSSSTLISVYGLYYIRFYPGFNWDTRWERSIPRQWLNNEFLAAAFTAQEREKLLHTQVCEHRSDASSFSIHSCYDYVWLPSQKELEEWFPDGDDGIYIYDTPFAIAQSKAVGARKNRDSNHSYYWTRTTDLSGHVMFYCGNTPLRGSNLEDDIYAVRPVIRVDLT